MQLQITTKLSWRSIIRPSLSTKDAVCYVWHEAVGGIEWCVCIDYYTLFYKEKKIEKKN